MYKILSIEGEIPEGLFDDLYMDESKIEQQDDKIKAT
jgi:hypothetical protein